MRECQEELTQLSMRCSLEAIERTRDASKQEEETNRMRVVQSDKEAADLQVATLSSDVINRDAIIDMTTKQLLIAHLDNISLSATLQDQKEKFSIQCALLESQKDELERNCTRLEEEVKRLLVLVDAQNDKLRTSIQLLKEENTLIEEQSAIKCASLASESDAFFWRLHGEFRARMANKDREMQSAKQAAAQEKQLLIVHAESIDEEATKRLAQVNEENRTLREKLDERK